MRKIKLFITMLLLSSGTVFAQAIDIPLEADDPNAPDKQGSRSIVACPSATLDEALLLTISYPLSTLSQVVISDEETGAVVYSAPYNATRSLTIDLSDEGLEDGIYTLRVYAFGKWWTGEFSTVNTTNL